MKIILRSIFTGVLGRFLDSFQFDWISWKSMKEAKSSKRQLQKSVLAEMRRHTVTQSRVKKSLVAIVYTMQSC